MSVNQWNSQIEAYMAQIQLGHRPAFEKLYQLTSGKLFALVSRMIPDRDNAAEVLQESYIKIWHSADRYRADLGGAWAWICQVTRNAALDRLRQHSRQLPIEDESEIEWLVGEDSQIWLEQHDLSRCLQYVKEQPRKAIVMAYLHGLTHQELVQRLNAPLGTLKSWIRRGLKELNECLHA